MTSRNAKNVINGAILGSLLGTIGSILVSNQKLNGKHWAEEIKNFGERVFNNHDSECCDHQENSTFVKGTLLGLLIGAGSALLLTPKTGTELREELVQGYQDMADKTQEILKYVNQRNIAPKRRYLKRALKRNYATAKEKTKTKH